MSQFRKWLQERVPIEVETLQKTVQGRIARSHEELDFCLGGTPLILFCILAATGILLTFLLRSLSGTGVSQCRQHHYKVRMGWLIRGIHTGASHHDDSLPFCSIFDPRFCHPQPNRQAARVENWILGVALFLTTLTFAFTGYSLIYRPAFILGDHHRHEHDCRRAADR